MGDTRRFDLFADLITSQVPGASSLEIADVAGGKGYLRAALHQRGIRRVTTWDKRRSMPAHRPGYRRAWFDYKSAPDDYGLVVGMHPDEGTDHIVMYAALHRIPFVVCPCCVKPSAAQFSGQRDYRVWCSHLAALARGLGMRVDEFSLRMHGCSTVFVGRPR